jgi:integrase
MRIVWNKDKGVKAEPLKDLTWKRYEDNLIKLWKVLNPKRENEPDELNLDFLKDVKKIKETLTGNNWGIKNDKSISNNTIKNYLNAIIAVLKLSDKKNDLDDYIEYRNELQEDYNDGVNSHKKSQKQTENWITMDEWTDVLKKMKLNIKNNNLWDKDYSSLGESNHKRGSTKLERDYLSLQNFILMSLYRYLPPVRNDYEKMPVITQKEYRQLSEDDKKETNYLVKKMSDNTLYFVMNEYKTKKKYGEKKINIPPNLAKLLRKWLKINKSAYLFVDTKGTPLSSNKITKYLTSVFKEHTGKNVSSTLLRHIYLSAKYGDTLKEMEKDADIMGHSVDMQKDYIKKDD